MNKKLGKLTLLHEKRKALDYFQMDGQFKSHIHALLSIMIYYHMLGWITWYSYGPLKKKCMTNYFYVGIVNICVLKTKRKFLFQTSKYRQKSHLNNDNNSKCQ